MPARDSRPALLVLLPMAMVAGTLLYAMLAVLAPFIIDDLGLTRAQLGLAVTVFSLLAALLSPVAGSVTDRLGARHAMLLTFAAAAVGFVLLAGAGAFPLMLGAAAVLALSQAVMNPGTNKMIAQEFDGGGRGLITGIKQSGVQMGSFLAGVAFPAMAIAWGWRRVPLVVGLLFGLIAFVGFVVLPHHAIEPEHSPGGRPPGFADLPAATWWTAVFALFMGLGGSPVFSFLPLYATEVLEVSEASAGLLVGVPSLVGVASRIGWSVIAERRNRFPATLLHISLIAVLAGLLILASASAGLWLLWVAAVVSYLSISAWNSVAMLAVIVESGRALAGKGTGVVLMGFILGLAVSPPIFGWSVDRLGTYTPGFVAVVVCFGLAVLTMALRLRSDRKEVARAGA